ncbi:hypothetical protein HK101_003075, partial [Irineochytrium annulatum]
MEGQSTWMFTFQVFTCGHDDPCCSSVFICGRDAIHCGDSCQSQYSYNNATTIKSTPNPDASCYGERFGKQCYSGYYVFDGKTWVINADAYTGDAMTADFVAEPLGLRNGNLRFGSTGGVLMALAPKANDPTLPWVKDAATGQYPAALGARLTSTSYLNYGTIKAQLLTSGTAGVVTAFISYSDEKDEIDWEITSENTTPSTVQSNFFYRGVIDYTKSKPFTTPDQSITSQTPVTLQVDWTSTSITWLVNGVAQRTVNKADTCSDQAMTNCSFPSTPSKIQLALWDGGAGSQGTRDWAGGYVPWDSVTADPAGQPGYAATFLNVMIQCAGDPTPTGPPARKLGYYAPSLNEPAINVSVPYLPFYSANAMGNKGSIYTGTYGLNWNQSASGSSSGSGSGGNAGAGAGGSSKSGAGRIVTGGAVAVAAVVMT